MGLCGLQTVKKQNNHAMQLQRSCADQDSPSSADDGVHSGPCWKRSGSDHLLLPPEAVEEQHGAALQPGCVRFHAHPGSAAPCLLLPL